MEETEIEQMFTKLKDFIKIMYTYNYMWNIETSHLNLYKYTIQKIHSLIENMEWYPQSHFNVKNSFYLRERYKIQHNNNFVIILTMLACKFSLVQFFMFFCLFVCFYKGSLIRKYAPTYIQRTQSVKALWYNNVLYNYNHNYNKTFVF